MVDPSSPQLAKRQRVVFVTGLGLVAFYFLFQWIAIDSLGTGVAFLVAIVLTFIGFAVAVVYGASSRRKKMVRSTVIALFAVIVVVSCRSNLRRASLERKLHSMGARVMTAADAGDGVWFRYKGIYLPCWIKNQLGNGFFADIQEVDWSHREIPLDDLSELSMSDPILTLNLSASNIDDDGIARLSEIFDAKQVLVNSLSLDVDSLEVLTEMPSLSRIAAVDTTVTNKEAVDFARRHPKIQLVHGDSKTGYGFVIPKPAASAQ